MQLWRIRENVRNTKKNSRASRELKNTACLQSCKSSKEGWRMKAKPKKILYFDTDKKDYMVEMDNHWYYLVRLNAREISVFRQPYSYLNHQPYIIVPQKTSDIPLEIRRAIAEGLKTFPWRYAIGNDKLYYPPDGFKEDMENYYWKVHEERLKKNPGVPFNLDE